MSRSPVDYTPGFADLDASRRHKLIDLPEIIRQWVEPHGGLAGRRVLDFGCGFGEMAAGIALACAPAMVVGIDISEEPIKGVEKLKAILGEDGLPSNLSLEQVKDGDLGSLDEVDVIVSWSAIEHVARDSLDSILRALHARLAPGGILMLQVSPLYFSPFGGHLWPCDYGPWEHLQKTSAEVVAEINRNEAFNARQKILISGMFLELNRLTAPELIDRVAQVGFRLLRQQIDRTEARPPAYLATAYTLEALITEQVVLLLQREG